MPEHAVRFRCAGAHLCGVVHLPDGDTDRGVLIVVGGPQYRVGSHRQFVLLARSLAQAGIAAMRFDYRGMGDSDGEPRTFEHVHDDIAAALDHFHSVVPGLQRLVLWGLCDGASASLAHAALDRRVTGLVLLNPWVRTEAGIAGAYLRRYYLQRFFDPDFWSKVRRGEFDVGASVASAVRLMRAALGVRSTGAAPSADRVPADRVDLRQPLPVRMLAELRRYAGRVLVILSGDDLTAEEFRRTTGKSRAWRRELAKPRVTRHQLPAANHTFSREVWRDQVASWTAEWVRSL